MDLKDKCAVVTGASSGIGRAAAILFAAQGAGVVVASRRKDPLDALEREIAGRGGSAIVCIGDVRDEAFHAELVGVACARFGGLDIAFNNAGTLGALGAPTDISPEQWHETIDTNLTSAFLAARAQIPAMLERGGGSIVFTSSFVGNTVSFPGMSCYAASKAGLLGLTQTLAAEYGPQGIRVNALLPGGTDTPMGAAVADSPEARTYVEELHALKRTADPEEIARAALFLASDASSFTTGSALYADGGVSISRA